MNENGEASVSELNPHERARQKAFDKPGGVFLAPDLMLMFWHGENAFGYQMTPDEATDLAKALLIGAATCTHR